MNDDKETTKSTDYLGTTVTVKIDRPLHSKHPKYDWMYQLNYGFVPGTLSPDGEELDAYVIGPNVPVDQFVGTCIAVIHRTNDDDDKLIVVPKDQIDMTDEEISKATNFQEQYFQSKIIRQESTSKDEYLLCFDDQGAVIESQPRNIIHNEIHHVWHGVVNIWIINHKKEILCTKRSVSVSGNSGKWQTYVGGHVRSDSNFLETARREIDEEVGLYVEAKDLRFIEKGNREDTMHVFENFALLDDDAISQVHFKDGEIVEAKWFSFDEYQSSKTDHPELWCNSLSEEQYGKICKVFGFTDSQD